jgi:hypothetical protein
MKLSYGRRFIRLLTQAANWTVCYKSAENLYGRLLVLSVARGNSVRLGLVLSSINSVVLAIEYIAEVLIVTTVYIYILNLFP